MTKIKSTVQSQEERESLREVRSAGRLTEVLDEISRLHKLDDDWDLDGARRIDTQATEVAARLVRLVEETASQNNISWQPPKSARCRTAVSP